MNRSIEELKIRANKLQKSIVAGDPAALKRLRKTTIPKEDIKRKTCLNALAMELGFNDWGMAKSYLEGDATASENRGTYWYSPKCSTLLNHWFADYTEAREFLAKSSSYFLLPYKNQFLVVDTDYLKMIDLWVAGNGHWQALGRDAVAGYGSHPWHELTWLRVNSLRV